MLTPKQSLYSKLFNRKKISLLLFQNAKSIYQFLKIKNVQKQIVFIVGCQRSGTTLTLNIFDRDLNAKIYGEFSELSSNDANKIRLNPLETVKKTIEQNKVPLIVLKPLVETQNLLKLIDFFNGSKALWIYRHYKSVASSNLTHFGIRNGINDLRPIVNNVPQNWRSENISENVRRIVHNHFSEDMNPYDAAALFWFVRNSLFFQLNLSGNPNVMLCKYEDLVVNPLSMMKKIYTFIDQIFPGGKIISRVHAGSLAKGESIKLSPEIDRLCNELLDELNKIYQSKNYFS